MRGAIALGDGLKENATLTGLFLGCKNTSNRVFFESAFNFFISTGDTKKEEDGNEDFEDSGIDEDTSSDVIHHGIPQSCADFLEETWGIRQGCLVV